MFLLLEWIRLFNTKIKDCLEQTDSLEWFGLYKITHEKMDHLGQIVLEWTQVSIATYETELSIFFMISSA